MSGQKRDVWQRWSPNLGEHLREMFVASGVTDPKPLTMTVVPVEGGYDVYVVSRSRGRVRIGTLPLTVMKAQLADAALPYIDELEIHMRLSAPRLRPGSDSLLATAIASGQVSCGTRACRPHRSAFGWRAKKGGRTGRTQSASCANG